MWWPLTQIFILGGSCVCLWGIYAVEIVITGLHLQASFHVFLGQRILKPSLLAPRINLNEDLPGSWVDFGYNKVPANVVLAPCHWDVPRNQQKLQTRNLAPCPNSFPKHHSCSLLSPIRSNELSKKALWQHPREQRLIHKLRKHKHERLKIPLRLPWVTHLPASF